MLKPVKIKKHQPLLARLDYPLLVGVALLLVFGVVMVYDASVVYASTVFGGKYHFLILQAGWVLLGLLSLLLMVNFDYHHLSRVSRPLLYFSLFLLLILAWPNLPFFGKLAPRPFYDLFVPQLTELKAYRWIFLNPAPLPRLPLLDRFSFQPTDLAKLALVIFLASWLSEGKDKARFRKGLPSKASWLVYLKFLVLLFFVVLLTVAEPDFGTATILALTMVGTYFFANAPLSFLLLSVFLSLGGATLSILASPYRRERLTSFLRHTEADPLTVGYHLQQALIALGSGGWAGLGLGQSRQKYEYLPEAATDSIFAVVGEELGFLGTTAVLLLFLFVVWRGLEISRRAPDELGRLLAGGIVTWLTAQALINIAALTNLLPLTGVTLPFLSYGGSSLVVTLTAIGILLNISRQTVEVRRK